MTTGGYIEEYKARYQQIRDTRQRVIIDGICSSACTHYYDKAFAFVDPCPDSWQGGRPPRYDFRPW